MKTKQILSLFLALVMTLGLLPVGAWAADGTVNVADLPEFIEGTDISGTKTFKVSSKDSLEALGKSIKDDSGSGTYNMSDVSFYLANDIDLSSISTWMPISNVSAVNDAFAGTFDGNGHIIKGLRIVSSAANQGLFGQINGATIKNLRVEGNVSSSNNYVGGVVGKVVQGTIENCSFGGSVTTTKDKGNAGGITGYAGNTTDQTAAISCCANMGSVTGETKGTVGGIVGYAKYTTIRGCYNVGTINGATRAGGIAGQLQNNCNAANCYNIGAVSGSATASGICDFLYSSSKLSKCFSKGAISGSGTGELTGCEVITSPDGLLGKLKNDGLWAEDTNNINVGYPVLAWQTSAVIEKVPVTAVTISGTARVGKALTAKVTGDAETYQWQRCEMTDGEFLNIDSASAKDYTLTDGDIGKYLRIVVTDDKNASVSAVTCPILMSETDAVAADKAALTSLPAFLVSDETLTLPTAGKNGSEITWTSSNTSVIANAGSVKLPASGIETVTLTAALKCGDIMDTKDFSIRVYSKAATEAEKNDPAFYLANAAASLKWFHLRPVYGTDTNAADCLKAALDKNGYDDLEVAVKSVENPADGSAAINKTDGAISYYYVDPAKAVSGLHGASIPVTFTLKKGEKTTDYSVNAVLGWDAAKVKAYLETNIIPKITVPAEAENGMTLPHYVYTGSGTPDYADYTQFVGWTPLTWTSSDANAVEIGSTGANYAPYTTTIRKTLKSQTVVLTARLAFNLTASDGSEAPITLDKTYSVTVPAVSAADREAEQKQLLAKLDTGLSAKGLADFVTGEKLTPDANGIYAVVSDIQFPTTRDFGVDGKYYPITIESSDKDAVVPPDVSNAARVSVYRPLPGAAAKDVTLKLTMTDKAKGVSASKDLEVRVLPLTQEEINTEIKLMEQVKAHYFDGIKNANSGAKSITTDLHAFQEAYLDNGNLTWAYDSKSLKNHGIVPEAMNGWEKLEQWRCFRSSNPAVISNENLLVTRQKESKAVTVTSCLSSEVYGKYAVRYPNNADFRKLYYQPVSADLVVTGTNPTSAEPVAEKLTVSFTLQSADSTWIPATTVSGLAEGSTVFDVFNQVLKQNGYGFDARGSYVYTVTNPSGKKLGEFDDGNDSGWMFKVNGVLPSAYMAACPLNNNDSVVVFFTKDYTQEASHMGEQPKQEQKTVSVSDGKGGVAVTATVSGKTAIIAATDEQVAKLAAADSDKTVKLDMTTLDKTVSKAVVPAKLASAMSADTSKSLAIALPGGTVKLDGKALAKTAAAGKDVTVSLETVESGKLSAVQKQTLGSKAASAVVVDINVLVDGGKTTSFDGGTVSVALPYAPKSGEDTSSLTVWYLADDGTISPMHGSFDAATKSVTFSTPHLSSYAVVSFPFADVSEDAWYYGNAAYVYVNGLFTGTSATTFAPESTMTRAMLAEVLYRMAGSPAASGNAAFADVSDGTWYANAVNWAAKNGIVTGVSERSFAPEQLVTREQTAAMLCRYAKLKGESVSAASDITKFTDAAQVSDWAASSMQWAVSKGLFKGDDGALSPNADATRAQMSAILQRYLKTEKAA